MWTHHLWNLISHARAGMLSLGGSTLAGIVVVGVIGIILGFALTVFIECARANWDRVAMKAALRTWPPYAGAIGGLLLAWSVLFLWSLCTTVYQDHQNLVEANRELRNKPIPVCPLATSPSGISCPKTEPRKTSADPQTNFQAGPGSVVTNNQSGGTNVGTYINQADAPRHLSPPEITNLSNAARAICPSLPKFGVTASGANAEAQRYAEEIVAILDAHGCNATFGIPIPSLEASVVGIHIGVTDIHNISPSAFALQRLLNSSGLSATISPKGQYFYVGDDFVLAIGAKD